MNYAQSFAKWMRVYHEGRKALEQSIHVMENILHAHAMMVDAELETLGDQLRDYTNTVKMAKIELVKLEEVFEFPNMDNGQPTHHLGLSVSFDLRYSDDDKLKFKLVAYNTDIEEDPGKIELVVVVKPSFANEILIEPFFADGNPDKFATFDKFLLAQFGQRLRAQVL
ncbi:hypothetical protein PJWF_00116 [Achromobacter phage JWF]|uniref:hypothetical protein n=1 Tax=Achromobacter phage JWF TaxID=1589748 RepID=UPI000588E585|nr:hypothetical protein AXJ13_gp072 [Achromobacter phage JWF]AJD83009.1 hypothetical protein PJWF_00116 [Achromobacter phage JWF]